VPARAASSDRLICQPESLLPTLLDMRRARNGGPVAVQLRRQARLAAVVDYARRHSAFYRALYSDVPEHANEVTLLPVTDKRRLMTEFDDWITDRAVSLEKVRAFADDPDRVGDRFLGKYQVATSSGSSGYRGIFLFDRYGSTVIKAVTARAFGGWLRQGDLIPGLARGGRVAMVIATGGHYGSSTVAPHGASRFVRVFSVFEPLGETVERLNDFRPAIVMGYAGHIALLAAEQAAGRLRINPRLVVLGAQGLADSGYERIAKIFDATVGNGYGACEFMCAAASCARGWLHVNSDWVILEPVDAEYQPVRPGELSHTVLLSNLANRVQPILRYDLGDAVMVRPDQCPCGNPFPSIKVQGRTTDAVVFRDAGGQRITIAPVALTGIVDRNPGIELSQVVQTSPTSIRVRLTTAASADPELVWSRVHGDLQSSLATQHLGNVTIERATEPPQLSPNGKYRLIIALASSQADTGPSTANWSASG
jgi:phenylacetate-CoA ligase